MKQQVVTQWNDDVQWDDNAQKEVKDMKTSIINPEVNLIPTKRDKDMIEANKLEVANKTPVIEP